MERYAPYAICYAGHPERVARPVVDALLVVVPDHDAEVTEASLCQRRLQMVAHENRLLLGGVLAALPCLSAQRLVLYGQAEEVDALLAVLAQILGYVLCPAVGERGIQSSAVVELLIVLHPSGRAPRRCEEPQVAGCFFRRLDERDDPLPIAGDRECLECLIVFVGIGVLVQGKVVRVDLRAAEVVAESALLVEVRLHNLLLILPTEPGVVVGRGLGERGAESEYLLIPPVRVEVHNPSLCQPVRQKWDVGPLGQHLLAVSLTPVRCRDRHGSLSFPASACWSDSRGANPVLRRGTLMVDAGVPASCVPLGSPCLACCATYGCPNRIPPP